MASEIHRLKGRLNEIRQNAHENDSMLLSAVDHALRALKREDIAQAMNKAHTARSMAPYTSFENGQSYVNFTERTMEKKTEEQIRHKLLHNHDFFVKMVRRALYEKYYNNHDITRKELLDAIGSKSPGEYIRALARHIYTHQRVLHNREPPQNTRTWR